jgi:hypothetical protein
MRLVNLATLSITLFAGCQPCPTSSGPTLDTVAMPVGLLGHPLGTVLNVEGVRVENMRKASLPFVLRVETVNGAKLACPMEIDVDNVEPTAAIGQRCTLRGYETGRMVGEPEGAITPGEDSMMQRVPMRFQITFVAITIDGHRVEKHTERGSGSS